MTRKTTVCSDVKRTFFPETINEGDGWYEKILVGTATYKGYKFRATHRSYKESNGYDEYENLLECVTTSDVVAENEINFNQCIVDYVKGLIKKQHTKDVLIKMLMKTDLISYFNDCKYNSYNHRTGEFNTKMMKLKFKDKQKLFKKELEALPLYKLEELVKWCDITKAIKLCSKPNLGFFFNEGSKTVVGLDGKVYASELCVEVLDDDGYDRDVACSIHSPFYLLSNYAGMQF